MSEYSKVFSNLMLFYNIQMVIASQKLIFILATAEMVFEQAISTKLITYECNFRLLETETCRHFPKVIGTFKLVLEGLQFVSYNMYLQLCSTHIHLLITIKITVFLLYATLHSLLLYYIL